MTESRIDRARKRAAGAKRAFAGLAAVGLGLALALARTTHPGHAAAASSAAGASSRQPPQLIAPSSGTTPQVQTSVS
jgi:hypothetical protein